MRITRKNDYQKIKGAKPIKNNGGKANASVDKKFNNGEKKLGKNLHKINGLE